ncbi:endonuclease domain-containing protein [Mycobacterium sp. PDNC021]|uniref:endonuclease domain-containing protein n=1 Tax=Mycobacterium sp. PDNC021 TaxID=3391399 RepID=UPI003AAE0D15
MGEIEQLLAANGGVASAAQLREVGWSHRQIKKQGWQPLRRGWYAGPSADPQVVRAVAAGGVLGCASALRRFQVWVPDSGLHIRYPERARKSQSRVRSCHPYRRDPPITGAIDPVDIAVASAANCLDAEGLVVVLDSMLNKRMIQMADARDIVAASRFAWLHLAERCDPDSESGIETMIRLRLRALRIHLRTQVHIPGVGRIDLLVGDRLIIEADSREHHIPRYQADRTRDRVATGMGYLVIRLTYEDVVYRWDTVAADILAIIRRDGHLGPITTSA